MGIRFDAMSRKVLDKLINTPRKELENLVMAWWREKHKRGLDPVVTEEELEANIRAIKKYVDGYLMTVAYHALADFKKWGIAWE